MIIKRHLKLKLTINRMCTCRTQGLILFHNRFLYTRSLIHSTYIWLIIYEDLGMTRVMTRNKMTHFTKRIHYFKSTIFKLKTVSLLSEKTLLAYNVIFSDTQILLYPEIEVAAVGWLLVRAESSVRQRVSRSTTTSEEPISARPVQSHLKKTTNE